MTTSYDPLALVTSSLNGTFSADAPTPAQAPATPDSPSNTFADSTRFIMGKEGGYVADDAGKGETNRGINTMANPGIDIKNLTEDGAKEVYKKYWNDIGGDNLDAINPALAKVAHDTAINMGAGTARQLLKQSGGDPSRLIQLRGEKYQRMIDADPKKWGQYANSWQDRLNSLQGIVDGTPDAKTTGYDPMKLVEDSLSQSRPEVKPEESTWGAIKRNTGEALDIARDPQGGILPATGKIISSLIPQSSGWVGDTAIDVARAPMALTQTIAGLGNLATGGKLGDALDAIGYNPKVADAMLSDKYSPQRKQAQQNVESTAKQMESGIKAADGAVDTTFAGVIGAGSLIGSLLSNPSVIQEQIIRTLPDMLFGAGVIGKIGKTIFLGAAEQSGIASARVVELMSGAAPANAGELAAIKAGQKAIELAETKLSYLGHAVEGAQATGQNAWQLREDNPNDMAGQYLQIPAGVLTALIGRAASKIPGFGDVQTATQMAIAGPKAANHVLGATGGFAKRVGKGIVSEGGFQEFPQSMQEQIWQNIAQGKPWNEGVLNQGVQGGVVGGVMGGVGGGITKPHQAAPAEAANPLAAAAAVPNRPLSRAALAAGQQFQDLGITQPGDDLAAQRAASEEQGVNGLDFLGQAPQGPTSELANKPSGLLDAQGNPILESTVEGVRNEQSAQRIQDIGQQWQDIKPIGDPSIASSEWTPPNPPNEPPGGAGPTVTQQPADAGFLTPTEGSTDGTQAPQAVETTTQGQEEPAAAAVTRKQINAPKALAQAGISIPERKAAVSKLANSGFETVERRPDGFWLVNSATQEEMRLSGGGDAQLARVAIQAHVQAKADTAAASPNNDRLNPTEGQIEAGNYKKSDVIHLNGMRITLENPAGSTRSGIAPDGKKWETKMAHHYGEFKATEGADGDPMDVFIGPRPDTNKVFVVDQNKADGSFDEHKVMMGFKDESSARQGYLDNYEAGWQGLGGITEMTPAQFKAWAKSDLAKQPVSEYTDQQTNGNQNDTSAGAGGEDRAGLVQPQGQGGRGVAGGDQSAPTGHLSGTVPAGGAGQAVTADEAARSTLDADSVRRAIANEPIVAALDQNKTGPVSVANPLLAETRALDSLLDAFASITGYRGIAIHNDQNDGLKAGGHFFVSVDRPHMNVAWTIGHEFKHLSEKFPGIKKLYDRLWSMIDSEQGKRDYFEYLRRTHSGITEPYEQMTPKHFELLKDEMIADFMGKRFNDRAWLNKLAAQKPNLFGEFVREWIPLLDQLIVALRGIADKMTGVKNVDLYISQIEEAKQIAIEVATAWAEKNPKLAQSIGTGDVVQHAKRAGPKEIHQQDDYLVPELDGVFDSGTGNIMTLPDLRIAVDGKQRNYFSMPVRIRLGQHARPEGLTGSNPENIGQYGAQHRMDHARNDTAVRGLRSPKIGPGGYARAERAVRDIASAVLGAKVIYADKKHPNAVVLYSSTTKQSVVLEQQEDFDGKRFWSVKTVIPKTEATMNSSYGIPIPVSGITFDGIEKQQSNAFLLGTLSKLQEPNNFPGNGDSFNVTDDGLIVKRQTSAAPEVVALPPKKALQRDANGKIILNKNKVQQSAREQAELQAELDAENAKPEETKVTDAEIKAKGIHAEDAYPALAWKEDKGSSGTMQSVLVPNLYVEGKSFRVGMDQNHTGLWNVDLRGTWVGPTMNESDGAATEQAVKDFTARQVAARDLRERGFDLVDAFTKPQQRLLLDGWQAINEMPETKGVRRYDRTTANDQSLKAIAAAMGITDNYQVTITQQSNEATEKVQTIEFRNPETQMESSAILTASKVNGKWELSINTSDMGKGGLGAAVYQMVSEYAAKRGMTLKPEDSLSGINTYRRTEQQFSAALRTGKSNVMTPHPTQRLYGFEDNATRVEAHEANLVRMIAASIRNAKELVPGFEGLRYSPEAGVFTNSKGVNQEARLDKMLQSVDARAFGMGRSTLARAVMSNMMLKGELNPITSFKEPVLYSARETAELEYAAVKAEHEGKPTWMKAPNGKATLLNERQWIQTRTPSFKRWFGNWELFAKETGGVWSDDQGAVSKVVDENGEPLVVYHGTDRGGFYKFNQPGGTRRGDLGIFTTSNKDMARSYVHRGRIGEVTPPVNKADLEKLGYAFRETEDGEFVFDNNDGTDMGPYDSEQEAVDSALENFKGTDNVPAIYATFINLRNPYETNFEGANWDGSRADQFEVYDGNGDVAYTPDGREYMSQEEAIKLADEIGGKFEPASPHYESTDSAVREGNQSGDGTIIRQATDDGGGGGPYNYEPSDIFVAKHSTQLKSADFNSGEFGYSDDIRYSKQDQTETPEFKDWFKDSKVVDTDGKPLVVYHGTLQEFKSFSSGAAIRTKGGRSGAYYFAADPAQASAYAGTAEGRQYDEATKSYLPVSYGIEEGGNVVPAYLSLQNPLIVDAENRVYSSVENEAFATAQKQGNDGIIFKNMGDSPGAQGSLRAYVGDVYVAFNPGQIKSVFNDGTYGSNSGISHSLHDPDFVNPEDRLTVSTTQPTAKPHKKTGYQPSSYTEKRVIDTKDITDSKSYLEKLVAAVRQYNTLSGEGDTAGVLKELHKTIVDNLLWLHDRVQPGVRERAKLWYDGANRITKDWKSKFGLTTDRQAGGILAVFSPQKDWFSNVSLAERALTILTHHQNETWSDGMTQWVNSWVNSSSTTAEKKARQAHIAKMEVIAASGKTLSQMSQTESAYFVRCFDEAYFPRGYRLVTPEGGFDAFTANDDGSMADVNWGGFDTIEKAVSIFRDGSFLNLDKQLGSEHKVRNFYNNIVQPGSGDGHVTIDTHAIAAALLKAVSVKSLEVSHNFGTTTKGIPGAGESASSGASGTYGLVADAYRDAAAQRGLLAREMQSITWEAVRSLFPSNLKDGLSSGVNAIHDRVKSGEITKDQGRSEIEKLAIDAGGDKPFAWEGGGHGTTVADGATSFDSSVAENVQDRQVRTNAPKDARDSMKVSISASTENIPWIKKLYRAAQAGNELAHAQLQQVAFDGLKEVLKGTSASMKYDTVTGLYGGYSEPSLAVTLTFKEADRDTVLAALKQFADNYKQEQIHVRQSTTEKSGTQFPDGSYATPVYKWDLASAMERKQIQKVIDKSGLYGLTFGDGFVEAYYVGDAHDQKSIDEFVNKAERIGSDRLLGEETQRAGRSVARLWPYGHGDGGIGWGRADSVNPAGQEALQRSARLANDSGDRSGSEESGRVPPRYGQGIVGSSSSVAYHFSKTARTSLDSNLYGTGLKGLEAERLAGQENADIRPRSFFYVDKGNGVRAESGVGAYGHHVQLDNLYDVYKDPLGIVKKNPGSNNWERAVLNAGFDGYLANDPVMPQGFAVLLGKQHSSVPVEETRAPGAKANPIMESATSKFDTSTEGSELVRTPAPMELMGIVKNMAAIQAVAPSFHLKYGHARVLASEASQADLALSDAGAEFQFGAVRYSARDDLGFYSELSDQIEKSTMKQAPAGAWKSYIKALTQKGVKADEIEWTGVNEFLDLQQGKVSKEAILAYLDANGVKVQEVVLGNEFEIEALMNDEMGEGMTRADAIEYLSSDEGAPKYAQYQLPGGENYREVLLTLPDNKKTQTFQEWKDSGAKGEWSTKRTSQAKTLYQSNHWDHPNVLAHIRLNDRVDVDGAKTMFIEELQSDWQQQARKDGIKGEVIPESTEWRQVDGLWYGKSEDDAKAELAKLTPYLKPDDGYEARLNIIKTAGVFEVVEEWRRPSGSNIRKDGVPNAPFINKTDAWLSLALKRVIKMAVDGGYAKVAFVNGEQSADRYDLSKQISQLEYERSDDGERYTISARDMSGNRVFDEVGATLARVSEIVGKEMAQKIENGDGKRSGFNYVVRSEEGIIFETNSQADAKEYARVYPSKAEVLTADDPSNRSGLRVLSGLDLKVGGDGMKSFYNQIVPNITKDVLRKLGGGKLDTVNFKASLPKNWTVFKDNGEWVVNDENGTGMATSYSEQAAIDAIYELGGMKTQPGFTITDALREKVGAGLPQFSKRDLTETPEFKTWFSASKAVDADGNPLTVYHGTADSFDTFDAEKSGSNHPSTGGRKGFFFSSNPGTASVYAEREAYANLDPDNATPDFGDGTANIMPVYLSLQNPVEARTKDSPDRYFDRNREAFYARAEKAGADGIIVRGGPEFKRDLYIAFDPQQIKSVFNDGEFGDHGNISHSRKEIVGQTKRIHTARQLAAFSNVGFQVEVPTLKERAQDLWKDAGKKLAQGIVDQFAPVRELSKEAYGLLRLAKGAAGSFETLLKGGKLKLNDGVYDFDETQKGGVVDKLLIPLQGEHHDFLRWIAANRAENLMDDSEKTRAEGVKLLGEAKALDAKAKALDDQAKQYLQQAGNVPKSMTGNQGAQKANLKQANDLMTEAKRTRKQAAEKRALGNDKKNTSRENLFTREDIAAIKTLSDGDLIADYTLQHGPNAGATTRNRAAAYEDSLKTFSAFNKNVMDMAEQSGLIDGEARKMWENEFYVPFYRVSEEANIVGGGMKGSSVRQQAFKHLKGGTDKLNADLLDNTLMNWAHLLDASAKNRAAKATLEAAEQAGVAISTTEETARQMGKATGNKQGVVWFMDDGKQHYYLVDDPYVLTAISSLEYAGMRNPMMNAMGAVKNMLTVGVTASPFFKVRNLIRDSIQVIGTGNISYNPVKNVVEGWKLTNPENDVYFRLLAGGGTIHFGTMLEGSEAKRVQALVESGVDAATILGDEHAVKAFYRKFIEPGVTAYNELGNRGEAINRASLYDQLVKQGVSHADASLQARDLMDFSMAGSWTSVRFLTQVVPFLNARIQGLYKLGKAAKEDPKRMAYVTAAIAMASLALLAAYGDDDDWKKREDYDRDNFWWFKFGGTAFRIPKPFELGAIATLAERSAELIFNDEMTGARFRSRVLSLLGDNLSMNPIPQLVKPMLDVYANKNSFSGRPIETMGMERLKADHRFTGNTSMTARAASTAMNAVSGVFGAETLSPVQVDSLIQGYFGWLGTFVVGSADVIARRVTNEPTRPAADMWKAATGGMLSKLEDAPSRYVSHVYEQAKAMDEAYATWQSLRKEGKTEDAREFKEDHADSIQGYRHVEAVKGAIAKINHQIRVVELSDRDSESKRIEVNRLNALKDKFSRRLGP